MKTIAFILALLINASVIAQSSSPTYVKVSTNKVKVTWFYENGQVKETGFFIDDKKDGVWEHFNEKGIKVSEASYTEGIKDGNWSVWNENGVMLYHLVYENGKRKLATQWDDQGNLIAGVQAK
jgi:antitoxin component YwqK of YwqJK toxin-antitoxin module